MQEEEHIGELPSPSQIATPQWVAEQMQDFKILRKKELAKLAGVDPANLGQFLKGKKPNWGGRIVLYWYFRESAQTRALMEFKEMAYKKFINLV